MTRLSALTALICALGPARAQAPDARELLAALAPERLGLAPGEATLAMELTDKAGRVVSRTLRARIAASGGQRKMRLGFLAPADQKGIELLVNEERGRAPILHIWLPRAAELRRVTASGERFFGSDFAFSDFAERDLDQAEVTLAGEEEVGGVPAYRIDVSGEGGAWSKVTAWIAKEARVPLRVQFFRDGALVRQLEVKKLQRVDGAMLPTRLEMSDLVRGTRTALRVLSRSAAQFPDAIFQPEALGR